MSSSLPTSQPPTCSLCSYPTSWSFSNPQCVCICSSLGLMPPPPLHCQSLFRHVNFSKKHFLRTLSFTLPKYFHTVLSPLKKYISVHPFKSYKLPVKTVSALVFLHLAEVRAHSRYLMVCWINQWMNCVATVLKVWYFPVILILGIIMTGHLYSTIY